jgi:transcriptional regulator with GAF, ATPase, and Fis domain
MTEPSLALALAIALAATLIITVQRLSALRAEALAARREQVALQELAAQLERQARESEAGRAALAAQSAELEAANRHLEQLLEKSEYRADRLQTSAAVSRAAAEIRSRGELLPRVTELISEHFGYYHVGLFMVDDSGFNAVLQAASSAGGRRMLARGYRRPVSTAGTVGFVTGSGRPRLARRTDGDGTQQDNPDLPETRSELALPLRAGGRVIGALDIHSIDPDAFQPDEVAVLTALAGQIAVTIENSRLLESSHGALQEARAAQQRAIRREWDAYLGGAPREEQWPTAADRPRGEIRREEGVT